MEELTSAYNHTLLRRNKTQRLVEYYGQMFIHSTEYTIYQTISYPKICPDRQLTYPDFPKLVQIPALAAPQNPVNPVRIAPRCRSKNLKSCPDWDLAVSPIAQGPDRHDKVPKVFLVIAEPAAPAISIVHSAFCPMPDYSVVFPMLQKIIVFCHYALRTLLPRIKTFPRPAIIIT